MRVRAKALGFIDPNKDGHPREIPAGAEFDIPDNEPLARWMEKVERPAGEAKPAGKPTGKTPAPSPI